MAKGKRTGDNEAHDGINVQMLTWAKVVIIILYKKNMTGFRYLMILACFIPVPAIMTGCGSKEEQIQDETVATEFTATTEIEVSSESSDLSHDEKDGTIENESTPDGSRSEITARGAGYDEGEPLLSGLPEITYEYSDSYYEYYSFDYAGEEFEVLHEYDNWKIFDSNKIRNSKDMQLICEALLDIYQVHGVDLESYRTPEDMAYEWIQHNIVYEMPLTDARYKESAANVDLDPGDQNKTIVEMFKDRQ